MFFCVRTYALPFLKEHETFFLNALLLLERSAFGLMGIQEHETTDQKAIFPKFPERSELKTPGRKWRMHGRNARTAEARNMTTLSNMGCASGFATFGPRKN